MMDRRELLEGGRRFVMVPRGESPKPPLGIAVQMLAALAHGRVGESHGGERRRPRRQPEKAARGERAQARHPLRFLVNQPTQRPQASSAAALLYEGR